jgi:uncharacterized membrane protein
VNDMAAPVCAICGRQRATYVCQSCSRAVCGNCIDLGNWRCLTCQAQPPSAPSYSPPAQFLLTTWLFFATFAAIFIGILLIALSSMPNQSGVSGGAIILIGPIPIILGSGPYSVVLIALAAVVTLAALIVFLALRRHSQHSSY